MKKHLQAIKDSRRSKIILAIAFAIIGVTALLFAKAASPTASLSLSPASGSHDINTTFTVSVYEDSGTAQVNAYDIGLVFDNTKLQYVSSDITGSPFKLAPASPSLSGGTLAITGYLYPGDVPGDNVTGQKLIAKINFKVLAGSGSTNITFLKETPGPAAKSAVYLYGADPATNIWNQVTTGGTYTLTTPDTAGPTITNGTPANAAVVSDTVNVTATATDPSGVANATLTINGSTTPVAMVAGSNGLYSYSWNTTLVADGSYTLLVKATDTKGNVSSSALRTVTVLNAKPDLVVSSVTMSPAAPKAGDLVTINAVVKNQGALATTAGVSNATGFSIDGTSVGLPVNLNAVAVGATFPAAATWTATAGSHTLVVTADKNSQITESNEANNGNTSSFSVSVPDTTPPTFSGPLTVNPSTSPLVGTVTVTASATDSGSGMAKVEFYIDNVLQSPADTSSPFTFTWDTTKVSDGSHTVIAKAYDVAGNGPSSSATLTVTVKNIPTPGDASGDGHVTITDLNAVINHWLATGQPRSNGDVTGDGVVNILDLLQVLNNWGA